MKIVDNVDDQRIIQEYNDVFTSYMGRLPYVYSIKLQENAQPRIVKQELYPRY